MLVRIPKTDTNTESNCVQDDNRCGRGHTVVDDGTYGVHYNFVTNYFRTTTNHFWMSAHLNSVAIRNFYPIWNSFHPSILCSRLDRLFYRSCCSNIVDGFVWNCSYDSVVRRRDHGNFVDRNILLAAAILFSDLTKIEFVWLKWWDFRYRKFIFKIKLNSYYGMVGSVVVVHRDQYD